MSTSLFLLLTIASSFALMMLPIICNSWHLSNAESDDGRKLFDKLRLQSRSSFCVGAARKCFSTGQCCAGLICAAFDDYFGQKPEVPGYCVKEKDLQVCTVNSDCSDGSKCASLGRTGERYCLPRPDEDDKQEQLELPQQDAPISKSSSSIKGGLGAACLNDADCMALTELNNEKLCCQDVRRGRQGIRRICDRITSISVCLP